MHCPNWWENGSCRLILDGTSLPRVEHIYGEYEKDCLRKCESSLKAIIRCYVLNADPNDGRFNPLGSSGHQHFGQPHSAWSNASVYPNHWEGRCSRLSERHPPTNSQCRLQGVAQQHAVWLFPCQHPPTKYNPHAQQFRTMERCHETSSSFKDYKQDIWGYTNTVFKRIPYRMVKLRRVKHFFHMSVLLRWMVLTNCSIPAASKAQCAPRCVYASWKFGSQSRNASE